MLGKRVRVVFNSLCFFYSQPNIHVHVRVQHTLLCHIHVHNYNVYVYVGAIYISWMIKVMYIYVYIHVGAWIFFLPSLQSQCIHVHVLGIWFPPRIQYPLVLTRANSCLVTHDTPSHSIRSAGLS